MKNILIRSVTGLLFIVILISGILFHSYSFCALFVVIVVASMVEFYGLVKLINVQPQKWLGIVIGSTFFLSNYLYSSGMSDVHVFLIPLLLLPFVFIIELYNNEKVPFTNIAFTLLGIVYLALPFSLLNYFVHTRSDSGISFTPKILLGFFILHWISDTAAFLVGINFGKRRLFERISPKKSWEGSIGGGIVTLGCSYVVSIFFVELDFVQWLVMAGIIVVFGTYGDLVESLMKRSMNVKDSGNLLPGHGGILDRMDSILISSYFGFIYLKMIVFVDNF